MGYCPWKKSSKKKKTPLCLLDSQPITCSLQLHRSGHSHGCSTPTDAVINGKVLLRILS